jgi:hypothetical protein
VVPQGHRVRFSLTPDFDVIEKVAKTRKDWKTTEFPEEDALIIFSGAGRNVAYGPLIGDEISGMRKVWKESMVGMCSQGNQPAHRR